MSHEGLSGSVAVDDAAGGGVLDGVESLLGLFTRAVSFTGAWADPGYSTETALLDVLQIIAAAIPGVDAVSITHRGSNRARTVVATDLLADRADGLQYACQQGPCLQAAGDGQRVVCADIRTDTRWPELAARAEMVQTRSVLSHPLASTGMHNAALNLHSTRPGTWPDHPTGTNPDSAVVDVVLAAAGLALTALQLHQRVDSLNVALESNRTIGAAVGIVMAHARCTHPEALARLTEISQNHNIKLRAVAEDIVRTGALPDTTHRPGTRSAPPDQDTEASHGPPSPPVPNSPPTAPRTIAGLRAVAAASRNPRQPQP